MLKNIRILILKKSNNLGIFKIYPINNGNGITIGNTLRRILLSSITGYSISYLKIKGIKHEFSCIKGIVEDVTEIILNLKKIKFKLKKNIRVIKNKIFIKINIKNNKNKIYAKDINKFTKDLEVINKKLIICNKEKFVRFKAILIIEKGKGYVTSESKKIYKDFISLDSIFTPIEKVSIKVNSIDNNNDDLNKLEKLKIKIYTDGSITPINALRKSSIILIKMFYVFYKKENYYKISKDIKNKYFNIEYFKIKKLLNTKLKYYNFSVRTINCLHNYNIYKWKDLVILKKKKLLKIKNFGKKSLKELIKKMKKNNLRFRMNIKKYNL